MFGAQEVLYPQLKDMLATLDGYDYIGVGRDDGKRGGEYAAIFYKKDNIRLLDKGQFWLSEDTTRPNLGWDAACIRICTWGKFEDKRSHMKFFYFNLHMDHVGIVARRESAKLVVRKIREIAGSAPVVLTGDFLLVRDIEKKYDLQVLRFFMLSAHYRSPLNFSAELMEAAKNGLDRILTCAAWLQKQSANEGELTNQESEVVEEAKKYVGKFEAAIISVNSCRGLYYQPEEPDGVRKIAKKK